MPRSQSLTVNAARLLLATSIFSVVEATALVEDHSSAPAFKEVTGVDGEEEADDPPKECEKYMDEKGCAWTSDYNCDGQPGGKKGKAKDDGEEGYLCCCQQQLWQGYNRIQEVEAPASEKHDGNRWQRHVWEKDDESVKANSAQKPVTYDLPVVNGASYGSRRHCYERKDVAYVDGSFFATAAYWQKKCLLIENDPEVESIMVTIGTMVAFYRPYGDNSWCDMLVSGVLHESSRNNKEWVVPNYFSAQDSNFFGGSALFPEASRWDGFHFLPFWGAETRAGGCCASPTDNPANELAWGRAAMVSTCRRCETLAYNSGDFRTHGQFWDDTVCDSDTVPPNATFIRVTMGSVVDYFKPIHENEGICSMLKSVDKHIWSSDGVKWQVPEYYKGQEGVFGGSAEGWPKKNIPGDNRDFLSFWGAHYHNGGCCGSTLESTPCEASDLRGCFHQALRVEYCV